MLLLWNRFVLVGAMGSLKINLPFVSRLVYVSLLIARDLVRKNQRYSKFFSPNAWIVGTHTFRWQNWS